MVSWSRWGKVLLIKKEIRNEATLLKGRKRKETDFSEHEGMVHRMIGRQGPGRMRVELVSNSLYASDDVCHSRTALRRERFEFQCR